MIKKINLAHVATEKDSDYVNLENMSLVDITKNINTEDRKVAIVIEEVLPQINTLIENVFIALKNGGRLFYIGAGTSGRLGVIDASECPPTFGVAFDLVIGLIAGGDAAIRKAVEGAEDSKTAGYEDLKARHVTKKDFVLGIAASGRTPYVVHGLNKCQQKGIKTGCIVCSPDSDVERYSDFPVCVNVGPEFLTGSTRMKAGTAQKMVLNMVTTATMILLGKVKGNKMSHMKLSNDKLKERAVRTVMESKKITRRQAIALLKKNNYILENALA